MIVVKVEMWPGGDESRAKELTRATITNLGHTTRDTNGEYGDYEAKFMQSHEFDPSKVWKKSRVFGMHRKIRGAWDIVFTALFNAGLAKRNFLCMQPEAVKPKQAQMFHDMEGK